MPRPNMSLDMMIYEDPRERQSYVVSPAEEALLRARDVEFRDRPVEGGVVSPLDLIPGPRLRIPFRLPGEMRLAAAAARPALAGAATVPGRAVRDMGEQELEALLMTLERKTATPNNMPAVPDPLRGHPDLAAYRNRVDKMPMYDSPPLEMRVGYPGGPAADDPASVAMAEARAALRRIEAQRQAAGTVPGKAIGAVPAGKAIGNEARDTVFDTMSTMRHNAVDTAPPVLANPYSEASTVPVRVLPGGQGKNAVGKPARLTKRGFYFDEAAVPVKTGYGYMADEPLLSQYPGGVGRPDLWFSPSAAEDVAAMVRPGFAMNRAIAEHVARTKRGR